MAHSPNDGYTLLQGTVANTINAVITPNLGFDFAKDFAPISLFATLPNILVVHPSLGVRTMRRRQFITMVGGAAAKLVGRGRHRWKQPGMLPSLM